jgi:cobalt/nickel transport system permease protein
VHVPDGFLEAPTALAAGAVAAGAVAIALKKSRAELDDLTAPMAGLTASFVFAAQMINFPIAAGTSGHLMGGALTAALVGPWTAVLALTVVLLVQALLFADGGLVTFGPNVVLIALVTVAVSWAVQRGVTRAWSRSRTAVLAGAGLGAFLSVPVAALVFTGLFAVGGAADVPIGTVAAFMVGIHALIGLGEAAITVAVLGAVLAVRPDLVRAARHLRRTELAPRADVPTASPTAAGRAA